MTLAVLCCPQIDYYKHLTLRIRCAANAVGPSVGERRASAGGAGERVVREPRAQGPASRANVMDCAAGKGCGERTASSPRQDPRTRDERRSIREPSRRK